MADVTNQLIEELLETIIADNEQIKNALNQPAPTPPASVDYQPTLSNINQHLARLRESVDFANSNLGYTQQLNRIESKVGLKPAEQQAKQYVQIGAIGAAVTLVLLVLASGLALKWKGQRDEYEVSNWKWRHTAQVSPEYSTQIDKLYSDTTATTNMAWVIQQEQADATREAAQKAQAEAAAMNAQADELEGKKKPIGKKGQ